MSRIKIVFPDVSAIGVDLDYSAFEAYGEVVKYNQTSGDELAERISDATVIAVNKCKLTADVLKCAKKLKIICEAATGYDNIDLEYCRQNGIAVTNVAGYSTDCVAQLTFTMALNLMTHMKEYADFVSDSSYTKSGIANRLSPQFNEMAGKIWGIVGYGNIGKKVAEIARAFGCHIIAHSKTKKPDVECVDLKTLCSRADIISLHVPLTDTTRAMIGEAELKSMKKTAILINVARGAVTDEASVAEAIKNGTISALGCDVYSVEPFPPEHPYTEIKNLPNVCLTPHIAWGGFETRNRLLREMEMNLSAFLRGESRNRLDL